MTIKNKIKAGLNPILRWGNITHDVISFVAMIKYYLFVNIEVNYKTNLRRLRVQLSSFRIATVPPNLRVLPLLHTRLHGRCCVQPPPNAAAVRTACVAAGKPPCTSRMVRTDVDVQRCTPGLSRW